MNAERVETFQQVGNKKMNWEKAPYRKAHLRNKKTLKCNVDNCLFSIELRSMTMRLKK